MLDRRKVWGFFDDTGAREMLDYFRQSGDCYPVHAVIHPTIACNHSCEFCYHMLSMSKRKSHLRAYKIEAECGTKIIKELGELGTKNLIISGGGEPLNHPEIMAFIEAVSGTGMQSFMYTNLDAEMNPELVEGLSKFGGIGVNINAVDQETYKSLRGPRADFENVRRNIRALSGAGANMYGTIISDGSEKDLTETVEYCLDAGMKGVNVSPSFGSHADIKGLESVKSKFSWYPVNVVEPLEKTHEVQGRKFCQSHRFDITIGADYGLYPCCPTAYREEFMIVNLLDFGSFEEAWNSEQRKSFIRDFEPECDTCWFAPVNQSIAEELE